MKVYKNLFGDSSKINAGEIAFKDENNSVHPITWGVIVESGSNANGTYIKFGDGTMICWIRMSVTDQAINQAYGSLFIGTRNWTFPAEFLNPPTVTCSEFKWGTGAPWGGVSTATYSYAILRGYDVLARAAGTACTISAMAIGRWK
jgi:hypothetical protein